MTTTVEDNPRQDSHAARPGPALLLICVAQLMIVLDSTIANIALPFIQKDLGFSDSGLTWIVTIYALSFGSLLLLGGRLGDIVGRRRTFSIGLIIFAVASLLGGIATSEPLILAARALQGLGGALASPAALALITTTFAAGPERNRAMGVYAAMSGAGAAVGLVLGGWLTGLDFAMFDSDQAGWRLTFLINVPFGVVAAFLASRWLSESEKRTANLDIPGAVLGTAGLFSLVYGLSRAGDSKYGWDDTSTIVWLVAGGVLLAAFAVVESRTEEPLLPFSIFADRSRAASFAAMMLMPAAMFSMFFYLSIYVQTIMGYTPLETGFAFLPISVMIVLTAGVVSQLMAKIDPRFIAGTGLILVAVALWGFAQLPYSPVTIPAEDVAGEYLPDILPWILVMAVGMGCTFVPLTLTAVHGVREQDSGIGSGVLNTMQQVGGALGLALLATVASNAWTERGDAFAKKGEEMMASLQAQGIQPDPEQMKAGQAVIQQQVYTYGATQSFLFGVGMAIVAALIVWIFLSVKHRELQASENSGGGAHI
jgi:EmrB/QacA subfamily drug resistance transporter